MPAFSGKNTIVIKIVKRGGEDNLEAQKEAFCGAWGEFRDSLEDMDEEEKAAWRAQSNAIHDGLGETFDEKDSD